MVCAPAEKSSAPPTPRKWWVRKTIPFSFSGGFMLLKRDVLIHCERELYTGGIALHIAQENHNNDLLAVAQPLVFVETESTVRHEPCVRLGMTVAQRLMDELWNCGLRPSEGTGSAGSLAATERHLADMKKIAFHALKVPA